MPNTQLSAAVTWVGRAVQFSHSGDTDGLLLSRFIQTGDGDAFRELVQRLGPMVLGVCNRVAGNTHLAEDAFQVTFLVLARRAADVRPREAVRGWLYGVATRSAQKARAMSARRRTREVLVSCVPERAAEPVESPDADALRILDEEVGVLPEHLRIAVVLCELEGVSRKDAAARLGIPEGTLASRLAKARKLLAGQLRKRGVVLSASGLVCAFERLASASVSPQLLVAAGSLADRSAPVSATVSELSREVFKNMFLTKLKVVILGGLLLAAASCFALFLRTGAVAADPPTPSTAKPDEKKPQPAGPGTLLLSSDKKMVTLTPNGKPGNELTLPKGTLPGSIGRLSPDGTRAAILVMTDLDLHAGDKAPELWPYKLVVTKLGSTDKSVVTDVPAKRIKMTWMADGSRVAVTKWSGKIVTKEDESWFYDGVENILIDPATGKTEPLALPKGSWVLDGGRNAKELLVMVHNGEKWVLGFASVGDKEIKPLIKLKGWTGDTVARLSPDGKTVLYTDADPKDRDANKWGVSRLPYLLDVATRKRTEVEDFPYNAVCHGLAWSPDGKRIAYTWEQLHHEDLKRDIMVGRLRPTRVEVVVADVDSSNLKRVAKHVSKEGELPMVFRSIDWR